MLEVSLDNSLEPTYVNGDVSDIMQELNVAAAQGKQFISMTERRDDLEESKATVVIPVHKITRVRPVAPESEIAFLGRH